MKKVFFRTGNIVATLKKLQNQYNILGKEDFNNLNTDEEAKNNWASGWPKYVGLSCTKIEVDEENGEYCFALVVTDEQAASLPTKDLPNFTCEKLEPGFVRPTYKVKDYDEDGVWLGTYSDRGVCGFGGTPASIPEVT